MGSSFSVGHVAGVIFGRDSKDGERVNPLTKGGSISRCRGGILWRVVISVKSFSEPFDSAGDLSAFQHECIELFVHAAQLLSIPRSIGEIYGLLYASPQPIAMDTIMERLAMSKGSVSQGLRWLREVGAVRAAYIPGDRRDHFVAETELRKLATGFLKERIAPHLQTAEDYLVRITETADRVGDGDREFVADRLAKMQTWYRLANQVLPFFLQAAGKF